MIYMILFGLIVICVLLLCAWLYEKREGMAVLRASRRLREERDAAREKCELLANKNASLAHDAAVLRKSTVAYALQNWESAYTDIPGRVLYTEGGITLIYENGFINWCKTDSVHITFKNVPDYEAPSAEVAKE